MAFIELSAAVHDLRNSLRSTVGEEALRELTIRVPAGESDEASFFRLVNWSYALLFEAGRITVPYLLKLPSRTPSGSVRPQVARGLVNSLRTWCVHDIGFSSDRSTGIMREVQTWFIERCGGCPPDSDDAWRLSFEDLCYKVGLIVEHCQGAVDLVLSSPDDRDDTIADLQRRLDRSWPACRFDEVVSDACTRFGLSLNVMKFREPRLPKWRQYLETVPEEDDPRTKVIGIIERDILDHTSDILPINGNDVMNAFNLSPGPIVQDVLVQARTLFRSGIRDPSELLEQLKEGVQAELGSIEPDGT